MNRRHHAWKMPGQRVQSINKCLWTARRPKLEHVRFPTGAMFCQRSDWVKKVATDVADWLRALDLEPNEHPGARKSATWGAQRCNSSRGKYKQKALTDDPPGVMRNP